MSSLGTPWAPPRGPNWALYRWPLSAPIKSAPDCLVQLKIARDAPRLLELAILVWTIPAPVVQIDIAIPATGASGRVERLQHPADPSSGHNKVYEAPRELIGASGAALTEMPRHADRGLCCGAGGARMWMEEHIGKRVNHERVDEALATDATKIATGFAFCRSRGTPGRAR